MQINYTKWLNSSFLEENEKEIISNLSGREKNEILFF